MSSSFYKAILDPIFNGKSLKWLVTGASGFIGSHLVEALLSSGQSVVGIDNFSSGSKENLKEIKSSLSELDWKNFTFYEADIRNKDSLRSCFSGIEYCLHQAALGSVPRSMKEPSLFHDNNVTGFLNILEILRDSSVKKLVYASSSSVYGDNTELPKIENKIGNPLSPYALSKQLNEQYANLWSNQYGINSIGLRYFNVFGPRQNPEGAYAAVIPKWINQVISGNPCLIHGDGTTSRDFCFVANVVVANILAALNKVESHSTFNVGEGNTTSLLTLHNLIIELLKSEGLKISLEQSTPILGEAREGDVKHSQASIEKIVKDLDFKVAVPFKDGLSLTTKWFYRKHTNGTF